MLDPARNSRDERAIADRKNDGVKWSRAEQLETDGACSLRDRRFLPVFDVDAALTPRMVARGRFGRCRVGACRRDARAKGSHSRELDGIHVLRDEHLDGGATAAASVRHRLSEVARR